MVSIDLKNISQNGNLPQIGVKIKHIWNHHPDHIGWLYKHFKLIFSKTFFLLSKKHATTLRISRDRKVVTSGDWRYNHWFLGKHDYGSDSESFDSLSFFEVKSDSECFDSDAETNLFCFWVVGFKHLRWKKMSRSLGLGYHRRFRFSTLFRFSPMFWLFGTFFV